MKAGRVILQNNLAVPLSIIAFVVVAACLILRHEDGNEYLDGGDDADFD